MLRYAYPEKEIISELNNLQKHPGSYSSTPRRNKIVLTYQPHFYKVENQLWEDISIQKSLIQNRVKYLSKDKNSQVDEKDLTEKELLRGFKISGIYKGFSHFDPKWTRAFINEFDVKVMYDPCGGWGHRLLGAMNIWYHYNDADADSMNGCKRICNDLGIKHKTFTNHDAHTYTPDYLYDTVHTCPPYFDVEKYFGEKDSLKHFPKFEDWLNVWWRGVIISSLKNLTGIFSFVINQKLKDKMIDIANQEGLGVIKTITLGSKHNKSHFNRATSGQNIEYLVIMKKGV
jgi:hypothetical protein